MNIAATDVASETAAGLLPSGLIAPVLTPFDDELAVDIPRFIDHARDLLDNGCAGLAPFGTTGEALSVGIDERIAALRALVEAGIDPAKLMPGTGVSNLADTARLTIEAMELGCLAAMVLPPFYYKNVPDDGLYAWFARLIEWVGSDDLRIYLYHIPQVAGVGVPVPVVARLRADFPRQIVGIKDSSGDWANTEALMAIDGLTVYPGSEAYVVKAMRKGARGCISAMANTNAPALAATIAAAAAGRGDEADALHARAVRYRETVLDYAAINGQKRLLAMATGIETWALVRPPFVTLSEADGRDLRARLDALD